MDYLKKDFAQKSLEAIFSRNALLRNQSIIILTAEVFALLHQDVRVMMGFLGVSVVKLSAFFLVFSVLFFTLSSFNFYNSKVSLLCAVDECDAKDVDRDFTFFIGFGKWGVFFWLLGVAAALASALLFLYKVR